MRGMGGACIKVRQGLGSLAAVLAALEGCDFIDLTF